MYDKLKEKILKNKVLLENIDFDYLIVPSQKITIDFGVVNLNTAEVFSVSIKKQEIKQEKFKTYEKGFFNKYVDKVLLSN